MKTENQLEKIRKNNESEMVHLLSDARGIYIPENFYTTFDMKKWNIKKTNYLKALYKPNSINYWDCWEYVLNNAFYIDDKGKKWSLYQDGNLWAISEKYIFEEEF